MDRLSNFFGEKWVRFVIISLLFFILLRIIFAIVNNYIEIPAFVCNMLAVLIGGLGAYKIIWR